MFATFFWGGKWSNLTILFFADGLKSPTKTINSHLEPCHCWQIFCMLQEVQFWMGFLYVYVLLCSCLKWGRCPHFWNSNPLIYLLTVFISRQGCASPKGAKEGRMPVWIIMNVISFFSHNYGVVKTHHPGVHGFSSPKRWICHLHDCWRRSMICFVWFWMCWIDPSILWSSFTAGVWTLFDETW